MDVIYLLKDQVGNFKIGFSKHSAKQRIKSGLQTGNSGEIEIINEFKTAHKRKVETALHNYYKHLHVLGEFYSLSASDVNNFVILCNTYENALNAIRDAQNVFY